MFVYNEMGKLHSFILLFPPVAIEATESPGLPKVTAWIAVDC